MPRQGLVLPSAMPRQGASHACACGPIPGGHAPRTPRGPASRGGDAQRHEPHPRHRHRNGWPPEAGAPGATDWVRAKSARLRQPRRAGRRASAARQAAPHHPWVAPQTRHATLARTSAPAIGSPWGCHIPFSTAVPTRGRCRSDPAYRGCSPGTAPLPHVVMEPTARQREGFAESAGALGKGGECSALFFDMAAADRGGTTQAWPKARFRRVATRPQDGRGRWLPGSRSNAAAPAMTFAATSARSPEAISRWCIMPRRKHPCHGHRVRGQRSPDHRAASACATDHGKPRAMTRAPRTEVAAAGCRLRAVWRPMAQRRTEAHFRSDRPAERSARARPRCPSPARRRGRPGGLGASRGGTDCCRGTARPSRMALPRVVGMQRPHTSLTVIQKALEGQLWGPMRWRGMTRGGWTPSRRSGTAMWITRSMRARPCAAVRRRPNR